MYKSPEVQKLILKSNIYLLVIYSSYLMTSFRSLYRLGSWGVIHSVFKHNLPKRNWVITEYSLQDGVVVCVSFASWGSNQGRRVASVVAWGMKLLAHNRWDEFHSFFSSLFLTNGHIAFPDTSSLSPPVFVLLLDVNMCRIYSFNVHTNVSFLF